jgi:hypothetical protein
MVREDIEAAVSLLAETDRRCHSDLDSEGRGHLDVLDQMLATSEQVRWVQPITYISDPAGEIGPGTLDWGTVAVTSDRVIFLGRRTTAHWQLSDMTTVTWGGGGTFGGVIRVRINLKNDHLVSFTGNPKWKAAAAALAGCVEAGIRETVLKPTAAAHPTADSSTASVADELSKLAELHRAGALSDSEFADAKARLIAGT